MKEIEGECKYMQVEETEVKLSGAAHEFIIDFIVFSMSEDIFMLVLHEGYEL